MSDNWIDVTEKDLCQEKVSALIIIPPKLFPFITSRSEKLSPAEEIRGAFGFKYPYQRLPSPRGSGMIINGFL